MTKLISSVAAVVLGIATVASAGQGAMGKAAEKARDKAVKIALVGEDDFRLGQGVHRGRNGNGFP